MYCGDETGSFIGDIGSHNVRFGYGGEDNPKYVAPSYMATRCGTEADDHRQKKQYIPSSCYQGKLASQQVTPIMRMADLLVDEEAIKDDDKQKHQSSLLYAPQIHPNAFLQQGDMVQDWDALEQVWNTSMDVLRARDTLKHTKGGTPFERNNKNKNSDREKKKKNTKGENIRGDHESTSEGTCVHPILAVTPGHTHIVSNYKSSSGGASSTAVVGSQYEAAVHREQYIQYTELLMETVQAPAVFLAPSPMLSAFCFGRQTALVVDIGAGGCRVTPIVDGLVLKHAQRRNGRGGDWLGNVTWRAMADEKIVLRPRYQLRTATSALETKSPHLYRWAMQDVMYEFRTMSPSVVLEQWCSDESVPFYQKPSSGNTNNKKEKASDNEEENKEEEEEGSGNGSDKGEDMEVDDNEEEEEDNDSEEESMPVPQGGGAFYELPDGTHVDLSSKTGRDLCRVPELLFTDDVPYLTSSSSAEHTTMNGILSQHHTLSNLPLHKLIFASLSAVGDGDMRKDLASNIILTGGSSLYKNLEQRLSLEIPRIVPSAYKCRVIASRNSIERSCSAWIGASVLTSLGSFQQLWLSRAEYEEYGTTLAIQRFP